MFLPFLAIVACSFSDLEKSKEQFYDYSIKKTPYLFNDPDSVFKLPWDLEEISGLSYYKDGVLLAVQDEQGVIYFIDTSTGKVTEELKFGKSGDYEGIEVVNGKVWVMKSNGDFMSFSADFKKEIDTEKFSYGFGHKNDLEGLGNMDDHLIVACKADGEVNSNNAKGKAIYKITGEKPDLLFSIKQKELNSFIKDRKHFNKLNDFDPSAIAVNPMNDDLYILSADHVLVVYNKKYELKEVIKLRKKIYEQPEGIAFSPSGVLYLSSEGNGEKGELFVLSPVNN